MRIGKILSDIYTELNALNFVARKIDNHDGDVIETDIMDEAVEYINSVMHLLQDLRRKIKNKTITLIGSTGLKSKMIEYRERLEKKGYKVNIPAFDDIKDFDEFQICKYNRELIEKADRVDIIWDRRSVGTIFDFGMTFAMRKPIKLVYLEKKTFEGVMRKYEEGEKDEII